ncbi:uncharacterized protein GIQ15_04790 [Arthroderma uncinatum]|uniref:uncharacterized protein n=1 Tax=Arthroderma uncinatum TaxID=74035 RepID=UPI00144A7C82|nr:uncharacterized protein GIQ15_04790 [Arthroderma uncinatum]KAF3482031.1 hypothetical protein GIQ15_04790 [Arthroderma uncinatum]
MASLRRSPYFYLTCPLCQQDVDITQPAFYRVFPLYDVYFPWLEEAPQCKEGLVFVQGILFHTLRFEEVEYSRRGVLMHRRCLGFVQRLPEGKLRRLLDVIEPTFLCDSTGLESENGAFYYPRSELEKGQSGDVDLARLPVEIRNMISGYDVGRLEFLVRLAGQLAKPHIEPLTIPDTRFDIAIVEIPGTIMRIHLIDLGGRSYICCVSDPASGDTRQLYRDYEFGESRYLAIKTDGIGVVDMALDESNGRPNWIFNHSTRPFGKEISRVRDADLHKLRVISDSMKCRAILATNRGGVEPYFDAAAKPPGNSWIDSSLRVGSRPSKHTNPSTYFAQARYISFEQAKSITFYVNLVRLGITEIYVNDTENHRGYTVQFPERPPTRMKVSVCRLSQGQQHPFIQFDIDGQWMPSLPQSGIIIQQVVVDKVIGVWLGETFPLDPIHIGVVRHESAPSLPPGEQTMRVPDLSTFTSRW